MTRENSERLARYGFDLAHKLGRKKVTIVHKANIMKQADGLFLETCQRVAKDYPSIQSDNMIIDNCCMQMVSKSVTPSLSLAIFPFFSPSLFTWFETRATRRLLSFTVYLVFLT